MPRRKISEYRAKNIINEVFGTEYVGWSVMDGKVPLNLQGERFVVKVDQAVKQRFKRGLLFLNLPKSDLKAAINDLVGKGFNSILIEPYVQHESSGERYISMRREREGVYVSYSSLGGVEIESNAGSIEGGLFDDFSINTLAERTGVAARYLKRLRVAFDDGYISFLEINPYTVDDNGRPTALDIAVEVDSSAELIAKGWSSDDFRTPVAKLTDAEIAIRKLDAESSASFNLEVMNADGSIFLLLSGGGASVVIADEIFTLGYGRNLANYGEYSGNPSQHETEQYASEVLDLLLASSAQKKVVLIGGAVANFTDIAATFKGIVAAIEQRSAKLKKQGVKFFVRRGGPRQRQGLSLIGKELERHNLLGGVYDPSVSIPEAVANLVKEVE